MLVNYLKLNFDDPITPTIINNIRDMFLKDEEILPEHVMECRNELKLVLNMIRLYIHSHLS